MNLSRIMMVLLAALCCHSSLYGQAADRYKMIPGDSLVVYSVDLDDIRKLKELEVVPWEIISAFGKGEIGIDPLLISTIDFATSMPSVNGPEFGIVIKTKEPVDIADLSDKFLAEVTISPKNKDMKFRNLLEAPGKVVQTEPQTLLVGSEGTLRKMLSGKNKPGKAVEILSQSKFPVRSITMFESVKPIVAGALSDYGASIPPQFLEDLQIVVDELDYIMSGNSLSLSADISLRLGAKDDESAKKLYDALNRLRKDGLDLAEQFISAQIEQSPEMTEEVRAASLAYLARMKIFIAKADLWSLSGNEIAVDAKMTYSIPTVGVLTGLLLPAVQSAREAARRMSSMNNIRQLGLCILNYESAFQKLPARAICDADGEPLLSWRVSMLQFMDQKEAALYKEFHLDEPWDSEHNIRLLDRMPATFKHPGYNGPMGYTNYLAPYYEDTIWASEKPRLQGITDGTSNTIALIEVNDQHAVPWTKPEDIDLDEVSISEYFRSSGMHVLMFDCSVQFVSQFSLADPDYLEPYITSSGGEPVQPLQ